MGEKSDMKLLFSWEFKLTSDYDEYISCQIKDIKPNNVFYVLFK